MMHKYNMIYVGRKPLQEKNIAANVLRWGTGALNIDVCRIESESVPSSLVKDGWVTSQPKLRDTYSETEFYRNSQDYEWTPSDKGRWPANTIFSEECGKVFSQQIQANAETYFFITKEGDMSKIPQDLVDYLHKMITPTHIGGESLIILEDLNAHDFSQYTDNHWHGCIACGSPTEEVSKELMRVLRAGAHLMLIAPEEEPTGYKGACQIEDTGFEIRDSIFFARETDPDNPNFMYMPKASRSEREKGTEKLPKVSGAVAVDREEGSAGMDNPRAGAGRTASEIGNFHPTVKPIGIMEWLARDIPKGETVVDPFMGSGTMGVACVKTGHSYIGMEIDENYFPIADARIRHWNETYSAWNSGTILSDKGSEEEVTEEVSEEDVNPMDLSSLLGLG